MGQFRTGASRMERVIQDSDRLLAWDDFARADGALGTAPMGGAWEAVNGAFALDTELAKYSSGSAPIVATLNVGTHLVDCEGALSNADVNAALGLAVCVVDANNLLAVYYGFSTQRFRVRKIVGGVGADIADVASTGPAYESLTRLRVQVVPTASGLRVIGQANGQTVNAAITDAGEVATFSAATKCGLYAGTTSATNRWHNFLVRDGRPAL